MKPNPKNPVSLPWTRSGNPGSSSGKSWRQCFDVHLRPAAKPQQQGQLRVGIEQVDITPYPGVPKGGYSAMSQTAVGFRTRLKARVFYIRPAEGQSMCLIQSDLHAGSALIRNLVAEKVAAHTDIEPANVMLTCTHTHSGPGQLLESNFYNRFASHKPGLDWGLLQQVSSRISAAVIKAFESSQPAKIASGATDIHGLTRNRSMVPYLNNAGTAGNPEDPDLKYDAVNPSLHLVRFDLQADDGCFYPAGAFSNFSIHGTCIPASSDVFSADSWAFVSGELEGWIKKHYNTPWSPIHGPSQGTHGDIAPDVEDKDIGFPEARRIGVAIADHAARLFSQLDHSLSDEVTLRNGLRKVDFYKDPVIEGVRIASRPMIGTALTAGAYEHSTPLLYHLPFFKHGMGSARLLSTDPEQGRKRKVGGDLQKLFLPKRDFPHEILFQTLQLGSFVLVGVPFEATVKAGEEIAAAVRKAIPEEEAANARICVASLTNGYTGYTTTASEYEKQYYEGGHTLYGPNSNGFIASHCCRLMADTLRQGNVSDIPTVWSYDMQCRSYQNRAQGDESDAAEDFSWLSEPRFISGSGELCWEVTGSWLAPWYLPWHQRMVGVEVRAPEGNWKPLTDEHDKPVDDQGYDLEIRYARNRYHLRWYPEGQPSGQFRFVVYGKSGSMNAGPEFGFHT